MKDVSKLYSVYVNDVELWLLPKTRKYGRDSGKIVLAMTRGNAQLYGGATDYGAHVLEAGVQIGSGNHTLYRKTQDRPWSDEYHTFRLDWTPGEWSTTSQLHVYRHRCTV